MKPIRALMWCPKCGRQHIDEGEWATREHKKHRCVGVDGCGHEWTPLEGVPTVGIAKLERVAVQFDSISPNRPGYIICEEGIASSGMKDFAEDLAKTLIVPGAK